VPDPVLFAAGADGCDPCEHEPAPPVPIRFRPLPGERPGHSGARRADQRGGRGAATASLVADLVSLTFSPELHDFLEERGFSFRAGPAVVRGGDGDWSVSDGVTVALLRSRPGR
jgi:hypothetical protein